MAKEAYSDIDIYWNTRKMELRNAVQKLDDETCIKQGIQSLVNSVFEFEKAPNQSVYLKNSEAIIFLKNELQYINNTINELHEKYTTSTDMYFINDQTGVLTYCGKDFNIPKDNLTGSNLPKDYEAVYRCFIDKRVENLPVRICHILYRYRNQLEKQIANLQKGITGENNVSKGLEIYKSKYKVLQGVILRADDVGGKTSEIDSLIITDKGLVVTEIKNYGTVNQVIKITQDGQWSKLDSNYNIIEKLSSPTAQNARHCLVLERYLESVFGEDNGINVIPLTMIANEDVTIDNHSQSDVIRVSEFYTFINKYPSTTKLSKEMIYRIADELEKASLPENKFEYVTYRNAVEKLVDFNNNNLQPFLEETLDYNNQIFNLLISAFQDYSDELIIYEERYAYKKKKEQERKAQKKILMVSVTIPLVFILGIIIIHVTTYYGFRVVFWSGLILLLCFLLFRPRR